jgi:hypothetical protein
MDDFFSVLVPPGEPTIFYYNYSDKPVALEITNAGEKAVIVHHSEKVDQIPVATGCGVGLYITKGHVHARTTGTDHAKLKVKARADS